MIVIIIIVIILLLVGGYYLYNYLTKDTVVGIKTVDFIKYIHDAKDYKKISSGAWFLTIVFLSKFLFL